MSDAVIITLLLAAATFSIRFLGVVLGRHVPATGPWARGLNALPGCLIVSLVAVLLARGGPEEWIGAAIALGVAFATRNLPVTMVVGIVVVWGLRTYI
jgi:uncharacterized membrane protein